MHAHIGGMDAFARGLKVAHAIREDGRLAQFVQDPLFSYDRHIGAKIEAGYHEVLRNGTVCIDNARAKPGEWSSGNAGKSG